MFRPVTAAFVAVLLSFATLVNATESREQLQAFLNATTTLAANFDQRLINEHKVVVEQSSGTLLLSRPGKFRWRYQDPFEQEIVGNGTRVWLYDADLEQVTVRAAGPAVAGSPALLLSATQPLSELFDVSEAGSADGFEWVALKPLERDGAFVELRVGLRDGQIAAMDLVDGFGQTTELRFRDIELAPSVTDDAFNFVPPHGVDVIDETAK